MRVVSHLKLARKSNKSFRARWAVEVRRASNGERLAFLEGLSRKNALRQAMEITSIGLLRPSCSASEIHVVVGQRCSFPAGAEPVPLARGYEIEDTVGEKRSDIYQTYFQNCGVR